jgi:hypothetical protein
MTVMTQRWSAMGPSRCAQSFGSTTHPTAGFSARVRFYCGTNRSPTRAHVLSAGARVLGRSSVVATLDPRLGLTVSSHRRRWLR